jgi:putative Mg2+ transporter-C (MgtC) family protein
MSLEWYHAADNLGAALLLGALIGVERQWRQRMAGLRTNTLVALGAAGFVVFSQLIPGEASPTRVAAQVVSGIGFLGAGVIFREGLNVRGLNTAATLWCSAAVGLLCGIGMLGHAALMAGMVMAVNVVLRPIIALVHRQSAEAMPDADEPRGYRISVVCLGAEEARVRSLLLHGLGSGGLHLSSLDSHNVEDSERVEIVAELRSRRVASEAVEQILGRLTLDPGVTAARWREATEEA